MEMKLNDICIMRKKHPCKNDRFVIVRVGMDVKFKCENCGKEIMMSRKNAEKAIKKILKDEQ